MYIVSKNKLARTSYALVLLPALPNYADFEEARQLMEGLATLCPGLLQNTLRACRSVKAKRLFLALADIVGHEWNKITVFGRGTCPLEVLKGAGTGRVALDRMARVFIEP